MLKTTLIAIFAIVSLMLVWLLVQNLWRKLFADQISDEDVLAERRSCGDCGCNGICENNASRRVKNQEAWHV